MNRERLPNRRETTSFAIEHRGHSYTVAFSIYADGRVAEVFIDPAKRGSELTDIMRDAAVLASLALQHGAPLQTVLGALAREADGTRPASPIGVVLDAVNANASSPAALP